MGLAHQVCKSPGRRNTERLVEELQGVAKKAADGSLRALGVPPEQAVADLDRLKQLVQRRQPEDERELERMLEKYLGAKMPGEGEKTHVRSIEAYISGSAPLLRETQTRFEQLTGGQPAGGVQPEQVAYRFPLRIGSGCYRRIGSMCGRG